MAIAVTNPTPGRAGWILNATSADASGCEELMAAPATGISIVVDQLTINSTSAITVTIGQGKSGAAVETVLIGAIQMAANTSIQFLFPYGMVLASAKSLTVDASGAGNICIFATGHTIP